MNVVVVRFRCELLRGGDRNAGIVSRHTAEEDKFLWAEKGNSYQAVQTISDYQSTFTHLLNICAPSASCYCLSQQQEQWYLQVLSAEPLLPSGTVCLTTFVQLTVSDDLDSHWILIFTHSHFTNPPRDRPCTRFVGHTSTYWRVIKIVIINNNEVVMVVFVVVVCVLSCFCSSHSRCLMSFLWALFDIYICVLINSLFTTSALWC